MSELPWENKKIADIMSLADEDAKLSDSGEGGRKNDQGPPIPDILANAFADAPMEEAKIEIPEPCSDEEQDFSQTMAPPLFGELPDLSEIDEKDKGMPDMNAEKTSVPPELPPFMQTQRTDNTPLPSENKTHEEPSPLFEIGVPDVSPNPSHEKDHNIKKHSPPPLFEPFIPPDEKNDINEEENPAVSSEPIDGLKSLQEPDNDALTSIIGSDPFAQPVNDISEQKGVHGSPTPGTPESPDASNANPFESAGNSNADPFEPPGNSNANPFELPGNSNADPFEPPNSNIDPFETADNVIRADQMKDVGLKDNAKPSINVNGLKKNIEGISSLAKDLLKNLTKGKSLIERMDDMRADTSMDSPEVTGNVSNKGAASPFDTVSDGSVNVPQEDPFSMSSGDVGSGSGSGQIPVDPFTNVQENTNVENIRKVTPVVNPFTDVNDEDAPNGSHDEGDLNDDPSASSAFSDVNDDTLDVHGNDIIAFSSGLEEDGVSSDLILDAHDLSGCGEATPQSGSALSKNEENKILSDVQDSLSRDKEMPESMRLSDKVLSNKIREMKVSNDGKFCGIEDDIVALRNDIVRIDMQSDSDHNDVAKLSDRISDLDNAFSSFTEHNDMKLSENSSRFNGIDERINIMEGKMDNFGSSISTLMSENESIRSDLSRIEDNVSELVNSYTALLAQLHESLLENESAISRIDEVSGKVNEIHSRTDAVEKMHEDARSTSMELSRSISSLVDNLGNMSSQFQEFRKESEKKHGSMLERMDSVSEYVESELKKVGAKSYKGYGQNVHLSNIVKNSSNMKLCMEWLEFLMDLVGRNNLPDILSYYEELGWITEKVRMELLHYAEGIDFYMEKPDWKLTPDDHIKSIWFIESLAGMKVDKNRLSVIERDIDKVKKGSEIYGI